MATEIGSIKIRIGGDNSDLNKTVDETTAKMRTLASAGVPVEQQLKLIRGALAEVGDAGRKTGSSFDEAGSKALKNLAAMEQSSSRQVNFGFGPNPVYILQNIFAGMERLETPIKRMLGMNTGVDKFGQSFATLGDNLQRFGLQDGQITGMLHKVGNDFVQISKSADGASSQVKQVEVSFQAAGEQGKVLGGALSGVNAGMVALMGGSLLAGASLIIKTIKDYGDSVIQLDLSVRRAHMSLLEFQTLQKTLFLSGGLGQKEFASGVEGIAKAVNDATREENELSKMLKLNNVALEERGGKVISTNKALLIMADLIKNAANEQDKIKIATAFGVSKDFIPAVERGSEEIVRLQEETRTLGGLIDSEMIAKAQEFSEAWRRYSTAALTWIQAWAADAIKEIKRVYEEKNPEQVEQDAKNLANIVKGFVTGNVAMVDSSLTALKSSATADMTSLADQVVGLWDKMFGSGEVSEKIMRRGEEIKELARVARENNIFGSEYNFEPPTNVTSRAPPATKIPGPEDKSLEGLKRRLDQVKQMIASEDEALRVQRDRYFKDLDKFEEKDLIDAEEHARLKEQVQVKHDKKMADLIFSKLEESVATENEILARKHEKQLEDLRIFEENKTVTEQRAAELRKKMNEKYEMDKLHLTASAASTLAGIVETSMSAISGIIADESNKGFTVMKGIAVAMALVRGFEASLNAYTAGVKFGATIGNPMVGQALGITFAGIAAAGTAAMIAKIAGVGQGSSGGAGGAVPSGGGADASVAAGATSQQSNQTMTVVGLNRNSLFSGDAVREIAQRLIEYQRDGGRVVIA